MKLADLQAATREELARLAKQHGVPGWHALRKPELIQTLSKLKSIKSVVPAATTVTKSAPRKQAVAKKSPQATAVKSTTSVVNSKPKAKPKAAAVPAEQPVGKKSTARSVNHAALLKTNAATVRRRDVSQGDQELKERLLVLVRDPFWLQALWELQRDTVRRVEAALGIEWHRAVPVLRLLDVAGREHSAAGESLIKEVEIHGGCSTWFIPLDGQSRSYRLVLGYRTQAGRFHSVIRSNVVTPPRPGSPSALTGMWDDLEQDYQRILTYSGAYSETDSQPELRELFESRLGHPVEKRPPTGERAQDDRPVGAGNLPLSLNLEVVLRGRTEPHAKLTVHGTPVAVASDGTFQARIRLDDGRTLIPTVVTRHDGTAQRTVVLAVERNSRELDRPSPGE